jgi:hypothetical protein
MKDKILKLLLSNNMEDVLVGWQLLNSPENKPRDKEWYFWFDVIRTKPVGEVSKDFIVEIVGENYRNSNLWIEWSPKSLEEWGINKNELKL